MKAFKKEFSILFVIALVVSSLVLGFGQFKAGAADNMYTITFNANGGTGGTSTSMLFGAALTAPTVTRTGYTFANWSPAVPSTVPAVDTTYTAQWTAKTFTVTFNPQSGTVSPATSTVTYDSTYGAGTGGFPTPIRTGFAFGGWFTSSNGGGTQIFSTTIAARTSSQTLYAKWTVIITFDANGGTGGTSSSLAYGATLAAPTVTKTGYTFNGWSPAVPATVPAVDTTYTAQWREGNYTIITFNANGDSGGYTSLMTLGAPLTAPTVTKIGYTFTGWSPTLPATVPASDTTYTALWSNNYPSTGFPPDSRAAFRANYDYVITGNYVLILKYKGSGGDIVIPTSYGSSSIDSISSAAFQNCTTLTSVVIPSRITYISSNTFKGCTNLRAAHFSASAPPTLGSGVFDNCAPGFKVYYNGDYNNYSNPWYTYPTEPAGNVTIAFDTTGGTGGYSASMMKGAALSAPAVVKPGYTFTGWSPSVSVIVPSVNTTYTALWRETNPAITFNSNGGSAVEAIAPGYNNSVSKPADPVREGYNFGEWFFEPECITPVIWPYTITASVTFYTRWNAENSYTIIFNANGGTGGVHTARLSGDPLAAPVVARTGYTFAGWSPVVPEAVPAENTIYTAQWTANTYTVSYNGNGNDAGSTANSLHTYDMASTLTANGFTKLGHSVSGWSIDSGATAPTYTDGQNVLNLTPNQGEFITFYAVWSANYYTITFSANGGSGSSTNSMQFGTALTAPTVTKTGHTFANWSPSVPVTVPATDTTYTAQWTANQYTLTFDADGGTVSPDTSTVTYKSTYGSGTGGWPTPTRTGYYFSGWNTSTGGAGAYKSSTSTFTATFDHTLYAYWTTTPKTYTVTFNPQSGTVSPTSSTVTFNNTYGAGTGGWPTPTRAGYTFGGWYTGVSGSGTNILSTTTVEITPSQTLYAKWTASGSVTITFDANGGTGGTSSVMTIGAALTAPTVTRAGYTFAGWSPAVPSAVPAENTTYTAQWTARIYTVTFNPDGGTVTPTTSTVTYNSTYGAGTGGLPIPTRTDYTFGGWFTGINGTGNQVLSTTTVTITVSHPLYAKWTASNGVTITFNANGGTGGTSGQMTYGTTLTAPVVTKTGYLFAGWSPSVPLKVPAQNIVYTAQYYPIPATQVTKVQDGFKVNIKDWVANYKYQIWSYQKITGDIFPADSANQWVLSKAYTLGSSSDAIAEADGTISFMIAGFTSPDSNYKISVRIMNVSNSYVGEISDAYTSSEVQEVKITKVLVDGEYSESMAIKEIAAGSSMLFTVIGNNVPGTVYTARILETGTLITASNTIEFTWGISAMTPGTYTIKFTASNGATTDTKNVKVQLYALNSGIQYGSISSLGLPVIADSVLPKTITLNPSFTNGSFYYKVSEQGRTPIYTSGLFAPTDSIEHTFTQFGIYYLQGFVNRTFEVRIGGNYDDGFFKTLVIARSKTEPSSATLESNVNIENPIAKGTPVTFTANASIGGIGQTPVQYSFWRYDAKGYALVKDWSSDNTLDWTPARVGIYTIEVRAKGTDAGSFEVAKSVKVTVSDNADQFAQGVIITLNENELNANATARVPITIIASANSTNCEDLFYKFYVSDAAMGVTELQAYSINQECIWTPRKAGTYKILVLVKNGTSYGAYDAMETFEITVD